MLLSIYPNSEIEVTNHSCNFVQRTDRPRAISALDIKIPNQTILPEKLKPKRGAGWGLLHRGRGTIRRGTKRRVIRLGGALDSFAEHHNLARVFITLTCPGSTKKAVESFSAWSGYLLNALHSWVSAKVRRSGFLHGIARLHSWELQKRGAEHLHAAYAVPLSVLLSIQRELQSWFHLVLLRISSKASTDIFERKDGGGSWKDKPQVLQVRAEKVEKSVGAYLSKYLSKGIQGPGQGFSGTKNPRPARLWGASRVLKGYLSRITMSRSLVYQEDSSCPVLFALLELAGKRGLSYSVSLWRGGLSYRVRFFFSGNKQLEGEVMSEIEVILSSVREEGKGRSDCLNRVNRVRSRLVRLWDKPEHRLSLFELFGEEAAKVLADFASGSCLSEWDFDLVAAILDDYDPVNHVRLSQCLEIEIAGQPDYVNLELWPGMP